MQTPVPTDHPPHEEDTPPCVLIFNSNDPSGAGGLSADITATASAGTHALPVLCGAYARDTAEIFDHIPFDEDAVAEQARALLEDVTVQAIKLGFAGTPENLSTIAEIASDYPDLPLIAYMPSLSWWNEVQMDLYQDAFQELVLPQATVLVGSHSTLWRWLLPDWESDRSPTARDIARAAGEFGVPYTLITSIPAPNQYLENALATAETVLAHQSFERFEAIFVGAGDTLSATLTALVAAGAELVEAFNESLEYLDHSLNAGFRPGMGHVLPDRLFWAQGDAEDSNADDEAEGTPTQIDWPTNDTQH